MIEISRVLRFLLLLNPWHRPAPTNTGLKELTSAFFIFDPSASCLLCMIVLEISRNESVITSCTTALSFSKTTDPDSACLIAVWLSWLWWREREAFHCNSSSIAVATSSWNVHQLRYVGMFGQKTKEEKDSRNLSVLHQREKSSWQSGVLASSVSCQRWTGRIITRCSDLLFTSTYKSLSFTLISIVYGWSRISTFCF